MGAEPPDTISLTRSMSLTGLKGLVTYTSAPAASPTDTSSFSALAETIATGIDGIRTYNGEKVSFEGLYLASHTYTYQQTTELLAGDLAEIGIEIIPTEETGPFGPKVFSGNQVWDYETIIFGYPSLPRFSSRGSLSFVTQWGNEWWGSSYDGCVVDPYYRDRKALGM